MASFKQRLKDFFFYKEPVMKKEERTGRNSNNVSQTGQEARQKREPSLEIRRYVQRHLETESDTAAYYSGSSHCCYHREDHLRDTQRNAQNPFVEIEPAAPAFSSDAYTRDIERIIRSMERDESFQQMLLRKIDERKMTDVQCYRRALIDRRLFSKIRGDVHYQPSKPTAVALAIALELNHGETQELLKKAGYTLTNTSVFDIVIQYFLEIKQYNIDDINEVLYYYDQPLLGIRRRQLFR